MCRELFKNLSAFSTILESSYENYAFQINGIFFTKVPSE
jgi:hypothetical protein